HHSSRTLRRQRRRRRTGIQRFPDGRKQQPRPVFVASSLEARSVILERTHTLVVNPTALTTGMGREDTKMSLRYNDSHLHSCLIHHPLVVLTLLCRSPTESRWISHNLSLVL